MTKEANQQQEFKIIFVNDNIIIEENGVIKKKIICKNLDTNLLQQRLEKMIEYEVSSKTTSFSEFYKKSLRSELDEVIKNCKFFTRPFSLDKAWDELSFIK